VRDARFRLLVSSALLLFVELFLIRWLGSNVVYLSYFSNFVLLGSFLGIGVGFLWADRGRAVFVAAPLALEVLVVFVRVFRVEVDRKGSQVLYFGDFTTTGLPIWLTLPIVFVVTAIVMALISDEVARGFKRVEEPLRAYRLNIVGSLLGIGVFSVLAFLSLPPVVWGAAAAAGFLALLSVRRSSIVPVIALAGLLLALASEAAPGVSWSPYYKIAVAGDARVHSVAVNGIPHQQITSAAYRRAKEPLYYAPYQRLGGRAPGKVLIVGAGTGTDVAIALAEGATHVDAVEIDPRLYQLGRELQPDHAYQDPRVSVHVTDGRAFLERTNSRYDLILFALPDSLTLVSAQSSLRLESYLFTLEAMRTARAHLTRGGVFAMYNYYREQWLVDRYAQTLLEAYGRAPCVDGDSGNAKFAVLSDGGVTCAAVWSPGGRPVPAPARDDHPFPYLRVPSIPGFYLVALALMLGVALVSVRAVGGPFRRLVGYTDLFLMGVAFLLLETRGVVESALLFGTTWVVNALVFAGILVVVLAAIEIAQRFPRLPTELLYGGLFASLAIAATVSPSALLQLPIELRVPAAVGLEFGAVFFANLIFADRFRQTASSRAAFAANLLGAMLGGMLEYGSLLVGYRSLLFFSAVIYAGTLVLRPKRAVLLARTTT
jgi:spermidine synthase